MNHPLSEHLFDAHDYIIKSIYWGVKESFSTRYSPAIANILKERDMLVIEHSLVRILLLTIEDTSYRAILFYLQLHSQLLHTPDNQAHISLR